MRRSAVVGMAVSAGYVALASVCLAAGNAPRTVLTQRASLLLPFAGFALVGALLLARRPGHAIGRLYVAIGLSAGLKLAGASYAEAALGQRPALPGATAAAWLQNWAWWPAIGLAATLVFQLFPTGRPLTRRWRALVVTSLVAVGALTASGMFFPQLIVETSLSGTAEAIRIDNPIGVGGGAMDLLTVFGGGLLMLCLAVSIGSLVLRFRQARGVERLQLGWLAYSAVVLGLLFAAVGAVEQVTGRAPGAIAEIAFGAGLTLIPVATGVAVLRYRLYDIGRIVNRTIVYTGLTVVLGALYLGGVLVGRTILGAVAPDSSVAVAASTLVAAALFRPLRARLQSVVDRRFYRHKYDAARTVDEFRSRLRQEVDLDALVSELLDVVRKTVQPNAVTVWLRTGSDSRPSYSQP